MAETPVLQIFCAGPALAKLGGVEETVTVTTEVDARQVPFDIVHINVYVPGTVPCTNVLGELGASIVTGAPPTCVQVPIPIVGAFPFNCTSEEQALF